VSEDRLELSDHSLGQNSRKGMFGLAVGFSLSRVKLPLH
jgi:hypothetical protein